MWMNITARSFVCFQHSAVNPNLDARLSLQELIRAAPDKLPARSPLDERSWMKPGRSSVGAAHAR